MLACLCAAFLQQQDYTLTTTLRLVQPYNIAAMNDEFQDAKLISEKDGVGTFRITYHLFHQQQVNADRNWKKDDAGMTEYLRPRPAANWDAQLQQQIIHDLKADGIDPDKLDDKTLVPLVASWALRRSQHNDQFGAWMVEFKDGNPQVAPGLRQAFASQEPKGETDQQLFDREILGKGMYLNKTHADCTSTASYLATVLRAVGIPTRIIVTVPAADGNDPKQIEMLSKAIRHDKTRREIMYGIPGEGFANHIFNEVFVGGKWVRLNYDRLGQPIVDSNYEGLMTHIYTANDLSEIPFACTWGPRYGMNKGPKLSSVNPYQLLAAEDNVPDPAHFENDATSSLNVQTIIAILKKGDPNIPDWVQLDKDTDALLSAKEWLSDDDYHQMRDFLKTASKDFVLKSEGHPDVPLELTSLKVNDGDGRFHAYGVHLEAMPMAGVQYKLVPINGNRPHTWKVEDGVVWQG